jgi:ribose transport system permease protein
LRPVVIVGALEPSFLTPFNIQILLLAISINALVAFSQMIIIAIGQMNLSVGAIGGLAAISFAGMMEVWGLPWPVAALSRDWPSGLRRGW